MGATNEKKEVRYVEITTRVMKEAMERRKERRRQMTKRGGRKITSSFARVSNILNNVCQMVMRLSFL